MEWIFLAIGLIGGFSIGTWVGGSFWDPKMQSMQKQLEEQIARGMKNRVEIDNLLKEIEKMRKVVKD